MDIYFLFIGFLLVYFFCVFLFFRKDVSSDHDLDTSFFVNEVYHLVDFLDDIIHQRLDGTDKGHVLVYEKEEYGLKMIRKKRKNQLKFLCFSKMVDMENVHLECTISLTEDCLFESVIIDDYYEGRKEQAKFRRIVESMSLKELKRNDHYLVHLQSCIHSLEQKYLDFMHTLQTDCNSSFIIHQVHGQKMSDFTDKLLFTQERMEHMTHDEASEQFCQLVSLFESLLQDIEQFQEETSKYSFSTSKKMNALP